MDPFFEVEAVTLAKLRSDNNGRLISHIAALIQEVFSEPPWGESYAIGRLNFGLGVELMRKNPLLFVAKNKNDGKVIGYLLGQELIKQSDDERDQTLFKISGTTQLDYLTENNKRVFLCQLHRSLQGMQAVGNSGETFLEADRRVTPTELRLSSGQNPRYRGQNA